MPGVLGGNLLVAVDFGDRSDRGEPGLVLRRDRHARDSNNGIIHSIAHA